MNAEAINVETKAQFQLNKASEQISDARKKADDQAQSQQVKKNQVQPEELVQQIKSLTEDGLYSVRFENDNASGALVVKVVDRETDEVIRQIPEEELLHLTERLSDLRGNIVNTDG